MRIIFRSFGCHEWMSSVCWVHRAHTIPSRNQFWLFSCDFGMNSDEMQAHTFTNRKFIRSLILAANHLCVILPALARIFQRVKKCLPFSFSSEFESQTALFWLLSRIRFGTFSLRNDFNGSLIKSVHRIKQIANETTTEKKSPWNVHFQPKNLKI